METITISVPVDAETARAYQDASPEMKQKIELLLSLRLRDFIGGPYRSLEAIMDDIGAKAQSRGFTPKILEAILDDGKAHSVS